MPKDDPKSSTFVDHLFPHHETESPSLLPVDSDKYLSEQYDPANSTTLLWVAAFLLNGILWVDSAECPANCFDLYNLLMLVKQVADHLQMP